MVIEFFRRSSAGLVGHPSGGSAATRGFWFESAAPGGPSIPTQPDDLLDGPAIAGAPGTEVEFDQGDSRNDTLAGKFIVSR